MPRSIPVLSQLCLSFLEVNRMQVDYAQKRSTEVADRAQQSSQQLAQPSAQSPVQQPWSPQTPQSVTVMSPAWQPAVEIKETADKIYVQLLLPGVERQDIAVEATATDVVVSGARFSAYGLSQGCVLASEFHYGPFERVVFLPVKVMPQYTQAELHQGLLVISLTKA